MTDTPRTASARKYDTTLPYLRIQPNWHTTSKDRVFWVAFSDGFGKLLRVPVSAADYSPEKTTLGEKFSVECLHAPNEDAPVHKQGKELKVSFTGDHATVVTRFIAPTRTFENLEESRGLLALDLDHEGVRGATCGSHSMLHIWDSYTGDHVAALEGHAHNVNFVKWFPDNNRLLTGASDTTVRIWNVSEKKEIACLKEHTGRVKRGHVIEDGATVTSCGEDGHAIIWDTQRGKASEIFSVPHAELHDIAVEGNLVAVGSDQRLVHLFDRRTKEIVREERVLAPVHALSMHGTSLLAGTADGSMYHYEMPGTLLSAPRRSEAGVLNIVRTEVEHVFWVSTADGQLFQWDAKAHRSISDLTGPNFDPVYGVQCRKDVVASGSRDGVVRVYRNV